MTFDVAADAYQRFMGRYADLLARQLLAELRPHRPERALDVGAGTGALTAPLVEELGTDAVAAIDPSPAFVDALRRRLPGVDVRKGGAEDLPFPDASFDLVLAQLVIHFMTDPVRGVAEMARVAVPGGTVVLGGAMILDGPALVIQGAVAALALLSVLIIADRSSGEDAFSPQAAGVPGSDYEELARRKGLVQTEVFPLVLFATGGMMIFPAAGDLLTLFVALEVLSLPLYLLTGLARRRRLLSPHSPPTNS